MKREINFTTESSKYALNIDSQYLSYNSSSFEKKNSKSDSNGEAKILLNGKISPLRIKTELANLNQLTFEVTDSCNLKCKYCGYGEFYNNHDERHNQFLDFDKCKAIIEFLVNLRKTQLNIGKSTKLTIGFYGGEPLLNFKLIKQVVDYVELNPYGIALFKYTHNPF